MKKIKWFYYIIAMLFSTVMFSQTLLDTTNPIEISSVDVIGVRPSVDAPVTETTLTSKDIEASYYGQEMSYIISSTPSITTTSDGGHENGYTYFRLRGIDQTRINMTLNGVTLNEPEDQGVYFSNYPNFSQYIKTMQVQRGVGTSSNGVASYGGSVNFESKDGLDGEKSVSVGMGSFNTKTVGLNYGTGLINDKFSVYGGATFYDSDGYKYNSGGSGFSALMSASYYMDNDLLKLTAFTGKSVNGMAWLAVSEDDIEVDPKTNNNDVDEEDDFNQSFAQLQYIKNINSQSLITSTIYYNRLDGNYGYHYPINGVMSELQGITLKSNLYGAMSNYQYTNKEIIFNSGINLNTYTRSHVGDDNGIQIYENDGTKNDASVYSKMEYTLSDFTLYGDLQLRYTTFGYDGSVEMDKQDWLFFNPRGGVSYDINRHNELYLSIGQTHREPTRIDMFGGEDNLVDLNIIEPESVINYELGYKTKYDNFSLNANIFYMGFKNEITYLGAQSSDGLQLMTSVDKSYRSGLEVEFKYNLTENISFNNISTFMYARINGDDKEYTPLYTPSVNISQDIEYRQDMFYVNMSVSYLSEMYINLDNTSSVPSNFGLNSKVGLTLNKIDLSVNLNNLTNSVSYTGGYTDIGVDYFYVSAPFNAYVTLKYTL